MKKELPPEVISGLDDLLLKLGCKETLTKEFLALSLHNVVLFDFKQSDYGSGNISEFREYGCLVRAWDKMKRWSSLAGQKRRKPRNESLLDTLDDLSNYALIAKLCIQGTWPK